MPCHTDLVADIAPVSAASANSGQWPPWIEKPWGRTYCAYRDDQNEHWLAEVLVGGYSSRHYHRAKSNRLASLSAVIVVTIWTGHDIRRVIVQPGQCADVPAGLVHRFDVIRSGTVWEWYESVGGAMCDPADIVRLSENGMHPAP